MKKTEVFNRLVGLTSCLLVLVPAALALLYVRAFGVSVVIADAWPMTRLFDKWSSGTLHLSDLWVQHNEHRMLFPKGIELLLGGITQYDNIAEMYLIQGCFFITLVILFLAFRESIATRSWLFLFVPVSLLIFSLRQHQNMLFGFQINFAFTQTFGVLSLFLLYVLGHSSLKKLTFVAALGSGTVASFSTVQGLLVWPVGVLPLFVSPVEKATKKVMIVVWGLIGLGEWVAYFVGYVKPEDHPSLFYAFEHPLVGAQYFLTSLGSSLFWEQNSAFAGGLLLSCLALVSLLLIIYKDRRISEFSFWISLLLYSFCILTSITLGRSGFGVEQALESRYTSFSILAVVSVYAMLAKTVFEKRARFNTILLVAFSGIILLSATISYSEGVKQGSREKVSRERAAFILSTYETQPDELLTRTLYPSAKIVRKRAPILQRLGYNVFSQRQAQSSLPPLSDLSPVASATPSAIDVITGGEMSRQNRSFVVPEEGSFIELAGWAVDADNESVAGGAYVDVDGKLFPAFYGAERGDVAKSLGDPSYRYSGFERAIPVSEIGSGTHELSVIILTADRKGYYRPDQKVVLEVR